MTCTKHIATNALHHQANHVIAETPRLLVPGPKVRLKHDSILVQAVKMISPHLHPYYQVVNVDTGAMV